MNLVYTGGNITPANKKILIFLDADNKYPNTPPEKIIAIFIAVIIIIILVIAAIITVSVIYFGGFATITCINPVSIYVSNVCKTNCKYGATTKKQTCNKSLKAPAKPVKIPVKKIAALFPAMGKVMGKAPTTVPGQAPRTSSGRCNGVNSIYMAANNTCKYCEAGLTVQSLTCNHVCGLTANNKICDPNTYPDCVKNYNILENTAAGKCVYKKGCTFKYGPNDTVYYRITTNKNKCNSVCISENTAYSRSMNVFNWTDNGKCVQACPNGPAMKTMVKNGNIITTEAYNDPAVTGVAKCNALCDYNNQTNTIALGSGGCTAIANVCANGNYSYYTNVKKDANNKTTNMQTIMHGCNSICNSYISRTTTQGGCTTNCAPDNINAPYTAIFDGVAKCNCAGPNGTYVGTYKDGTKRKCNDTCYNYTISKNTTISGKCACINPNIYTYTETNHRCVEKPCSNTTYKIKGRNAAGTCVTKSNCPSCINDNGTGCNEQLEHASSICQSWNDAGYCTWVRNPASKGFNKNSSGEDCNNSLRYGYGGKIVKYVKGAGADFSSTVTTPCDYYKNIDHCTEFGGNTKKVFNYINPYSIGTLNDHTKANQCIQTNLVAQNYLTVPRRQCPG
jgi:hypothetical protein